MLEDFFQSKKELFNYLKYESKVLNDPLVEQAFKAIDRKDFVDPDYADESYEDYPLPIGLGQTISQPTTVCFMLEKLEAQSGDKVLDVGCGSGWTTALLGHIVGSNGFVYGVELRPELHALGNKNIAKYKFKNVTISVAGNTLGLPTLAPFNRILVSASANSMPQVLLDQLVIGGKIVIPIKDSIHIVEKISKTETKDVKFKGFSFVPLIS